MSLNKVEPQLKPELIPEEHTEMLYRLAKIPVATENEKRFNWHQKSAWNLHKVRWSWVKERINYLQMLELGYLPDDPFSSIEWDHPKMREMWTLYGDLYYSILKVLIKGFAIIAEVAIREGLDFPFNNPRELFTQIYQRDAAFGASEVFGTDKEECLDKLRRNLRQDSAFFRGRLEEKETAEKLLALKKEVWSGFWMFSIWNERFKKDLRDDWKNFLKCHKLMCQFMSQENFRNSDLRIVIAHWENGVPLDPRYGHVLELGIVKKCTAGAVFPKIKL